MRRILFAALLILLPCRPVLADPWDDAVARAKSALAGEDAAARAKALEELDGYDHAAAVELAALLFRAGAGRDGKLLERLRAMRNPRSLRAMAEHLRDEDEATAGLFSGALLGHPRLHLVGHLLRNRCAAAARKGDASRAERYFGLLRGRLDAGDRGFVRSLVRAKSMPEEFSRGVLAAFPDYQLWQETAGDSLAELVSAHARALGEEIEDAAAWLEAVRKDGARVAAALEGAPLAGERALAGMGLQRPRAALRAARTILVRKALAAPALANLERLHKRHLRLRFARACSRDRYLWRRDQRQRWDAKDDPIGPAEDETTIDFGDPAVRAAAEALRTVDRLLADYSGDDVPPAPGPPWHPRFFELNDGRKVGVDDIAFTPRERKAQDERDRALGRNGHPIEMSEHERQNVEYVNAFRRANGLRPLRPNRSLLRSAREHSAFQAWLGRIEHVFRGIDEPFGKTPGARMARAGYPREHAGGENVLAGTKDAKVAFDWWARSPDHRRNMLHPAWTEIGVGEYDGFWTQVFGSRP